MATNFPTSLDNLDPTRGTATDKLSTPSHVTHHTNEDDALEALQAKVGIDNSADTDSIDYKLTNASSVSPGHKHVSADISDLLPISSSTGVADGGKLVKTTFTGVIDDSFIQPPYFSTTQVFSGTAPTSYTDLDLSAVVGAKQRVVILKITTSASSTQGSFRTNGDTTDYGALTETTAFHAGGFGIVGANEGAIAVVITDTAGVVEWKAGANATVISVLAYW